MTTATQQNREYGSDTRLPVIHVHVNVLMGTEDGRQPHLFGGIPASTDLPPGQKSSVATDSSDNRCAASIHAHALAAAALAGQAAGDNGKPPGENGAGQRLEAAQAARPSEPIDPSGEITQRLQGLTVAVQELRRDLDSHSLEREQMPIFRQQMNIVQTCWGLLDVLTPQERGSGGWAALEGMMKSLCGLLQFQGVEILHSSPSAVFDLATMRCPGGMPAGASAASLLVARCRRPGFRLGQRILDYEQVDVMPASAGPEAAATHSSSPGDVIRSERTVCYA